MKYLILGGTRFIGRALVTALVSWGQDVTISSRKIFPSSLPISQITCERASILQSGIKFSDYDFVIDFTAYNLEDLECVKLGTPRIMYIVISTAWVSKLSDPKPFKLFENVRNLNYTKNKEIVEKEVLEKYGNRALVIRLPVTLGLNDHHKRLLFYFTRSRQNMTQYVLREDFLVSYIFEDDFILGIRNLLIEGENRGNIITFLSKIQSYNSLIFKINDAFKNSSMKINYRTIGKDTLKREIPKYVSADPLLFEDYISDESDYIMFDSNTSEYLRKGIPMLKNLQLFDWQLEALNEEKRLSNVEI